MLDCLFVHCSWLLHLSAYVRGICMFVCLLWLFPGLRTKFTGIFCHYSTQLSVRQSCKWVIFNWTKYLIRFCSFARILCTSLCTFINIVIYEFKYFHYKIFFFWSLLGKNKILFVENYYAMTFPKFKFETFCYY